MFCNFLNQIELYKLALRIPNTSILRILKKLTKKLMHTTLHHIHLVEKMGYYSPNFDHQLIISTNTQVPEGVQSTVQDWLLVKLILKLTSILIVSRFIKNLITNSLYDSSRNHTNTSLKQNN